MLKNKFFMTGMGSIMGSFNPDFFYSDSFAEYTRPSVHNDSAKIRGDFMAIGSDLVKAIQGFEQSNASVKSNQLNLFQD